MEYERIVVIGASAGGIAALKSLVSRLGRNFPAPVLVTVHLGTEFRSLLPAILERAGDLSAVEARQGESLRPGQIYTAVPNQHLMVRGPSIFLSTGPKENGFRPSVDVLFRSVAYAYGPAALGVVLSGALNDGTSGLYAIKRLGGTAIVQDPAEALFGEMPLNALNRTPVDHTLSAADIGLKLNQLVQQPVGATPPDADEYRSQLKTEVDISASDSAFDIGIMDYGQPTRYTCPSCHGVLFRIPEGEVERYRCHTGHGYSLASLMHEHRVQVEDKLWQGLMSLQESVALLNDAADRLAAVGDHASAAEFREKAAQEKEKADQLRQLALWPEDAAEPGQDS